MGPLYLPLVVRLEPSFSVDFTSCLPLAVVVGILAALVVAEAAAAGKLAASAAAAVAAVEGTVEAVVLAADTVGGPADD